ncbi:lysoplasmalogenase [Stackebrandtia soli]|uniref:lysoplasmalogenase n=1 Tax=Stackebrandtia soli TaxID=1892856 RepID=UPI0039E9871A
MNRAPMATPSTAVKALFVAYAIVTAVNLVSVGTDVTWLEWASKPLLMPLLLIVILLSGRSLPGAALMAVGLVCATVADVALLVPGTIAFLIGMGFFLVMQLSYITVFVRLGALGGLRSKPWAPIVFGVFWVAFLVAFWADFAELAVPIAVYSLALTTMATISVGLSARAGIGGTLFLVSDSMIALGIVDLDFTGRNIAIMTTYIAAQYLLVTGWRRATS